jgi:hypothetical protein
MADPLQQVRAAFAAIAGNETEPVRRASALTELLALFNDEIVPQARALRREDLTWLAKDQGWSHREIGEAIGVSSARVTQLIHDQRMSGPNNRRYTPVNREGQSN